MRRKSLILTLAILLATAAGVAGVLGVLLKHEPEFYATEPVAAPAGWEEVQTQSAILVTRVQDLKNDIRSKPEWGASFRAEDLNCFFRENLSADGGLTDLLPPGCHSPRVTIDGDKIRLGLQYGTGFWSTVIWVEMRAWLVKDETNVIALELCGLRAGALPLGCQSLLDSITEAAHDSNIDVTWYRHNGNPVGIFRFYAGQLQPTTQIHTFRVADGVVTLGGRTRLDTAIAAAPPGVPSFGRTSATE
jgi:hypothetical protein